MLKGRKPPRYLVVMLGLCLVFAILGPTSASANYSCNNYCYGYATWGGGTTGSRTVQTVVPMFDNDGANHITQEMWLIDPTASSYWAEAWIEVGLMSTGGTEWYFYAYELPGGGETVPTYLIETPPSSDYFNTAVLEIGQDTAGYSFHVRIQSLTQYLPYEVTNDPMEPSTIQIGSELVGTTSAYAEGAHWTDNMYIESGSYYYQTSDTPALVSPQQGSPEHASWSVLPSNSSTGGDFYSYCGC